MARQQPDWLTRALEDAAAMAVFSGIPADDCMLTPAQKQWLFDNDYSLDDLFSGRIEDEQKQAEADQFFADWNAKLGKKVFG